MAVSNSVSAINIVSYNMHGFNQGYPLIENLINSVKPGIFLLQEHWLTPANINQFDRFPNYFSFGSSAMSKSTELGMLYGRPFGGVMTYQRSVALCHRNYLQPRKTCHCAYQ